MISLHRLRSGASRCRDKEENCKLLQFLAKNTTEELRTMIYSKKLLTFGLALIASDYAVNLSWYEYEIKLPRVIENCLRFREKNLNCLNRAQIQTFSGKMQNQLQGTDLHGTDVS